MDGSASPTVSNRCRPPTRASTSTVSRWTGNPGRAIPPGELVRIAEGLVDALGRRVEDAGDLDVVGMLRHRSLLSLAGSPVPMPQGYPELTDEEMARTAGLDTCGTVFFDHHDPSGSSGWLPGRVD
jgi:hypothetical protein